MHEHLTAVTSTIDCRRCADCEHFDGVPGARDGVGHCHDPTAPQPRQTHESGCCGGFVATTTVSWRLTMRIEYGLPPSRRHVLRLTVARPV
jgi:hypothetical protein